MNIGFTQAAVRLGKLVTYLKARFKYFSLRTEDAYWQWVVEKHVDLPRKNTAVVAPKRRFDAPRRRKNT